MTAHENKRIVKQEHLEGKIGFWRGIYMSYLICYCCWKSKVSGRKDYQYVCIAWWGKGERSLLSLGFHDLLWWIVLWEKYGICWLIMCQHVFLWLDLCLNYHEYACMKFFHWWMFECLSCILDLWWNCYWNFYWIAINHDENRCCNMLMVMKYDSMLNSCFWSFDFGEID